MEAFDEWREVMFAKDRAHLACSAHLSGMQCTPHCACPAFRAAG